MVRRDHLNSGSRVRRRNHCHAVAQMSYVWNDMGIDGGARPPHCAAIVRHYRGGTYAFGK
jgi:hypothetical protein